MSRRFLLVGLTGGIATGKSTVSEILTSLGAIVLDADVLAREVVEPGQPALATIAREFGPDVLQADGRLDRKRLAAVVFAHPERRQRLEAITHPAIRDRFQARLAALEAEGYEGLVFWDAPVMIESGGHRAMDRLVVVVTDATTQRARAVGRDGDAADVERRIANQLPLAEKVELADYVIDNSGDRAATAAQTRRVHEALVDEASISARLLADRKMSGPARLAVALPVNMGNRGQNEIPPATTFRRLCETSRHVEFLAYHWRRSGVFVFLDSHPEAQAQAVEAVAEVSGLSCVGRGVPALARIHWHVPADSVTTKQGSVVLKDASGTWRIIAVCLSLPIGREDQFTGGVSERVRVLSWPSERDVLCAYNRPGEAGDVGQVTRSVIERLITRGGRTPLFGSSRTVGVIRDVLRGRGLRSS